MEAPTLLTDSTAVVSHEILYNADKAFLETSFQSVVLLILSLCLKCICYFTLSASDSKEKVQII
jgi:hypothetical protein